MSKHLEQVQTNYLAGVDKYVYQARYHVPIKKSTKVIPR